MTTMPGRAKKARAAQTLAEPTVYLATIDTRHWSFTAIDASDELARAAIMRGWAVHVQQTGADPDYVTADDISVRAIAFGVCYRDDDRLTGPEQRTR